MIAGRLASRLINVFTGLFAISTIVLMLVWYVNNAFGHFLPSSSELTVMRMRNYFTLATVFCAGLEFTLKRSLPLAFIFTLIMLAVAAFMLYTDLITA